MESSRDHGVDAIFSCDLVPVRSRPNHNGAKRVKNKKNNTHRTRTTRWGEAKSKWTSNDFSRTRLPFYRQHARRVLGASSGGGGGRNEELFPSRSCGRSSGSRRERTSPCPAGFHMHTRRTQLGNKHFACALNFNPCHRRRFSTLFPDGISPAAP